MAGYSSRIRYQARGPYQVALHRLLVNRSQVRRGPQERRDQTAMTIPELIEKLERARKTWDLPEPIAVYMSKQEIDAVVGALRGPKYGDRAHHLSPKR